MQKVAEKTIKNIPISFTDNNNVIQPQGALVSIDPTSGGIRAMVGGRDYSNTQFNRALANRQPGSAFKPILYAYLLENGYNTTDTRVCELTKFPMEDGSIYSPRNQDGVYQNREMTLREALLVSNNILAVKFINEVDPANIVNIAKRLGINSRLKANLSLALGTSEVSPLELASAYAPFINNGYRVEPFALLKIEDGNNNALYESSNLTQKILDKNVGYIITDILKDVHNSPNGTAKHLNIIPPAAVKTGTTQNNRDGWFIGYTKDLVTCIYIGHDNPITPLWSTGGIVAGPLWQDYINEIYQSRQIYEFEKPEGITIMEVCSISYLKPKNDCPTVEELFIKGTEPFYVCKNEHSDKQNKYIEQ